MKQGYLNRYNFILFFLLSIVLLSCEEEVMENIVVTEDLLYISGDVVQLTGRVVETNGIIDDHGFHISDNKDFSSPIIVSLGKKEDGLGRFIGANTDLNINTNYYFRSYMNVGGVESTGQVKEFETLVPKIDDFEPKEGIEGNILKIYGNNFTKDTEVRLGDQLLNIISIEKESLIEARVPQINDSYIVPITVTVQDTIMTFSTPFNYYYGLWELETTFTENIQIYEAVWLKENTDFIVGLGVHDRFNINNRMWNLDLTTYQWTELDYPGADYATTRLAFNSGSYWGAGDASHDFGPNDMSTYFWKYSNGIFEQKAPLPFQTIKSVAFHLNGELYVFGGELENSSITINTYKYNVVGDSWNLVDFTPVDITSDYPSFVYNDKAYFLQPDGRIWQFDPVTVLWKEVGMYVDLVKKGGAAVVLGDKAYIGLFENGRSIWEWDITNNSWRRKASFTGDGFRDSNVAAFAHNNKAFFFRSKYSGGSLDVDPRMELWSLDPNKLK